MQRLGPVLETAARQFVREVIANAHEGRTARPYVQVRTVHMANELRQAQLRTKSDLVVIAWDEIGNAFCLTNKGVRLQLTSEEVAARKAA